MSDPNEAFDPLLTLIVITVIVLSATWAFTR